MFFLFLFNSIKVLLGYIFTFLLEDQNYWFVLRIQWLHQETACLCLLCLDKVVSLAAAVHDITSLLDVKVNTWLILDIIMFILIASNTQKSHLFILRQAASALEAYRRVMFYNLHIYLYYWRDFLFVLEGWSNIPKIRNRKR